MNADRTDLEKRRNDIVWTEISARSASFGIDEAPALIAGETGSTPGDLVEVGLLDFGAEQTFAIEHPLIPIGREVLLRHPYEASDDGLAQAAGRRLDGILRAVARQQSIRDEAGRLGVPMKDWVLPPRMQAVHPLLARALVYAAGHMSPRELRDELRRRRDHVTADNLRMEGCLVTSAHIEVTDLPEHGRWDDRRTLFTMASSLEETAIRIDAQELPSTVTAALAAGLLDGEPLSRLIAAPPSRVAHIDDASDGCMIDVVERVDETVFSVRLRPMTWITWTSDGPMPRAFVNHPVIA